MQQVTQPGVPEASAGEVTGIGEGLKVCPSLESGVQGCARRNVERTLLLVFPSMFNLCGTAFPPPQGSVPGLHAEPTYDST